MKKSCCPGCELLLILEQGDCEVEDGVVAGEGCGGVHVDGAAFGRFYAVFGTVTFGVEHRAGGETDGPSAGKFGGEGHTRSASGGCTDHTHTGEKLHDGHEIVGCGEGRAIGKNNDRFTPVDAPSLGGIIFDFVRLGKV